MVFYPKLRHLRKLKRQTQNWAKIISMTLEGNTVDRVTSLYGAEHPILLLQGVGCTRRTFTIMERRLRHDGYRVFSINLGGRLGTFNSKPIETLAQMVKEKVERLYERYRFAGKISIVGYSKGGLIGRYYIQCLGGDARVRHLITLGTPHNGSPWAILGSLTPLRLVLESMQQMTPSSSLIKELQNRPFPAHVYMTSIYSREDFLNPYPGAVIELGPNHPNIRNICVDSVGHLEFLTKKSVYGHVKRGLRDPLFHASATEVAVTEKRRSERQLRLLKAS